MAKTPSGAKGVRLFKAVRELNVTADTIAQTLKSGGFELDAKLKGGDINAKLTPEMYEHLLGAFKEDAEGKARVRELQTQRRQESGDAGPAVAAKEEAAPAPEPTSEPEIATPAPEPEPEPAAEPAAPVLDPEPAAKPEPAPEPVAEEETKPQEETVAQVAETEPEKEEKPEPKSKKTAKSDTAEEGDKAEPDVTEVEKAPEPVAAAAQEEDSLEIPEPGEEEEAPEPQGVLRGDRYALSGTTVIGKIDVTQLDSNKRRKRKKKKKGDEVVSVPAAEAPTQARSRPKKKGRVEVDKTTVDTNIQATLQQVAGRGGGGRTRQKRRRDRRAERAVEREAEQTRMADEAGVLRVMEFVSTGELAEMMGVSVSEVIQKSFGLGMMVSINQRLDADTITVLADEFNFEVEFLTDLQEIEVDIEDDDPEDLKPRSPVVTIMGHVDHGKTSLLDYIRSENVVAGESGGITQHIGAYEVTLDDGRQITFLDTPGHEAFTAMRARGAQVTDIVILVVAGDDQVMPQTIEAINHAKAAGVPIVVALNKMDKPDINKDRILQQLSDHGVLVEQYGGKIQCEFVSAMTGLNIDDLLDKVLVEAELLELSANPDRRAVGTVIESRLDKGRGVVATILVQTGTLKVGDAYVAGMQSGRVRAMFDERDNRVTEAGPSQPVQILGFSGAPEVGDRMIAMEDERDAREVAHKRLQMQREQVLHARKHVSLADLSRRMALGELRELNLVVKADVGGSVEAISDALLKISNEEVAVSIVHSGVGAITESDVMLAAASDAIIIGFQVRPMAGARLLAEREEIDIRLYSIIYDAIEEVRDALEGLLSPEQTEKINGTAEVREIFRVPRIGTIAGSYVIEGKIRRNDRVRLIRDGIVIYNGTLGSLKRFKDDAKEVATGYECGLSIDGFNDIKVGDQVEAFEIVETKRHLVA
ncbi:translation initiation factor IF-2 [soil metagenome]